MELPRDWQEFLSSLNASRVRYLVIGAHALAAHGAPRYTADLDVWVEAEVGNAERVLAALKSFGCGSLKGLSAEDFQNPEMVVMLGVPPLQIDLLTSILRVLVREGLAVSPAHEAWRAGGIGAQPRRPHRQQARGGAAERPARRRTPGAFAEEEEAKVSQVALER